MTIERTPTDALWPGGVAPRKVAAEIRAAIIHNRPQTSRETHALVDAGIERYPDCHADMVRDHVLTWLKRMRRKRRAAK